MEKLKPAVQAIIKDIGGHYFGKTQTLNDHGFMQEYEYALKPLLKTDAITEKTAKARMRKFMRAIYTEATERKLKEVRAIIVKHMEPVMDLPDVLMSIEIKKETK